jgi:uncharacterized membrane protein
MHNTSREYIHLPHNLGEKAADVITNFVGSWTFVIIHALWFVVWIVARIEPFPFGLLTLLVSLEAIFLSTFVMMSQNRAAQKDHIRDDREAQEVDILYQINQQQLEILTLLRTQLCVDPQVDPDATDRVRRLVASPSTKLATSPKPASKPPVSSARKRR